MAELITSARDVRQWVEDHCDAYMLQSDIDQLVSIIAADAPRYGTDWADYLESLPENLADLL